MRVREPISTATNLAYGLAGAGMYYAAPNGEGLLTGIMFCLLMFGSSWYHWTVDREGAAADEVGMYAAYSTMLVVCLPVTLAAQVGAALVLLGVAAIVWRYLDSNVAVPALVIFGIIIASPDWMWLVVLVAGFVLGGIFKIAATKYKNDGNARMHDIFHGLWHVDTAIYSLGIFLGIQGLLPRLL